MEYAVLAGRVLLAAVFTIAALAKLADRKGSRQAVEGFGVPASLAVVVAGVLPACELAVAIGLMVSSSARWAALGALALLAAFSIAIAINLARGKKPDCHCFGQLHSAPAGSSALARNGALAAVAAVVAWVGWNGPGPSVIASLDALSLAQALGLAAGTIVAGLALVTGWFILHLLRQHGRLLVRMDALEAAVRAGGAGVIPDPASDAAGLPVGSPAPEFSLPGLHGETLTLAALRSAAKPVMLLFTAPGCGPCESLMPEVGQWQRDHGEALTIAVVTTGTADVVAAIASEHGLRNVLRQNATEVADSYHYLGTPSAVLVSPDGRIATPLVAGPDPIRSLMAHGLGGPVPVPAELGRGHANGHDGPPIRRSVPRVGEAAPVLDLPDLHGKTRSLAEFIQADTLVLFWNPGCGFCEQMLGDLKAWEEQRSEGAPRLVVISTGSVDANKAMGLRSPVLLDPRSEAMSAFGASGTPMAVRVAEGRIASSLAAGASAVLSLAGGDNNESNDFAGERGEDQARHG